MKFVLAPVGTRGDVQPLLALAITLAARGHSITFCAPSNFAPWIKSFGFTFHSCSKDFQELMCRQNFLDAGFSMLREISQDLGLQFSALLETCSKADAIIGSMLQLAGPSIAELFGIPYFYTIFSPLFIYSNEHPPISVAFQNMPKWLNAATWSVSRLLWNFIFRKSLNKQRSCSEASFK